MGNFFYPQFALTMSLPSETEQLSGVEFQLSKRKGGSTAPVVVFLNKPMRLFNVKTGEYYAPPIKIEPETWPETWLPGWSWSDIMLLAVMPSGLTDGVAKHHYSRHVFHFVMAFFNPRPANMVTYMTVLTSNLPGASDALQDEFRDQ